MCQPNSIHSFSIKQLAEGDEYENKIRRTPKKNLLEQQQ